MSTLSLWSPSLYSVSAQFAVCPHSPYWCCAAAVVTSGCSGVDGVGPTHHSPVHTAGAGAATLISCTTHRYTSRGTTISTPFQDAEPLSNRYYSHCLVTVMCYHDQLTPSRDSQWPAVLACYTAVSCSCSPDCRCVSSHDKYLLSGAVNGDIAARHIWPAVALHHCICLKKCINFDLVSHPFEPRLPMTTIHHIHHPLISM